MFRIRRGFEFPLLPASQAELTLQPHDPVAPVVEALRDQFRLQAQRSVSLAGLHMDGLDGDLNRSSSYIRRDGARSSARKIRGGFFSTSFSIR
jgi:hypothetical protein